MKIYPHPSPNFNDRDGQKIDTLVIHYTGMKSAQDALDRLSDPDFHTPVSAHYLIDEKGKIYQLVEDNKRAWHAGNSWWNGQQDVNSRSIGIELYNSGKEPFTNAQMASLKKLSLSLIQKYSIRASNIVGHSDIAPNRKMDPGPHFDWKKLSKGGIGRWPSTFLTGIFNAKAISKSPLRLAALFRRAGYQVSYKHSPDIDKANDPTLTETILAFQRRYQPELFLSKKKKHQEQIGLPNPKMVRQLRDLVSQRFY